jgi:hypothetical protein
MARNVRRQTHAHTCERLLLAYWVLTSFSFVLILSMAICNLAPFTAWPSLFETRTDVHPVMRPLLASKSMNGGVKITIVGHDSDPIVANLNKFLTIIDHNARKHKTTAHGLTGGQAEAAERDRLKSLRKLNDSMAADDAPKQKEVSLAAGFSQSITIYVMNDFAQRDALFSNDDFPFDPRTSLFVWSASGDPFTKDEIGERLMRFLVLVAAWDRNLLAENLFSAIGVRVVDMLRQNDHDILLQHTIVALAFVGMLTAAR